MGWINGMGYGLRISYLKSYFSILFVTLNNFTFL